MSIFYLSQMSHSQFVIRKGSFTSVQSFNRFCKYFITAVAAKQKIGSIYVPKLRATCVIFWKERSFIGCSVCQLVSNSAPPYAASSRLAVNGAPETCTHNGINACESTPFGRFSLLINSFEGMKSENV